MRALLGRLRSARCVVPRALRRYGDGTGLVNRAARHAWRGAPAIAVLLLMTVMTTGPVRAGGEPRLLAFGDSLTAGYGLAPENAFPAQLQARLAAMGVKVEVINAGVSGDTSAGALARIDWALGDRPDYALVEIGANDMLRGLDPRLTEANIDKILARLKAAGVKTMLVGMRAAGNWGAEYQQEFDAIYPALAHKYALPFYPFFLDGVALDPTLNQPDGLHPNAKGVARIVERIAPDVARFLQGGAGQG